MPFEGFRLLSPIAMGRDGGAYRAEAVEDSLPVEVRELSAARADPDRWRVLSRRLRLATMVQHPGAVPIHALDLEADPPFVVLDWIDPVDANDRMPPLPSNTQSAWLERASILAGALALAHRKGLIHGGLGLGITLGMDARRERLDFTGIDVEQRVAGERLEIASIWNGEYPEIAPEVAAGHLPDSSSDIYGFGQLLKRLAASDASPSENFIGSEVTLKSDQPPFDRLIREMLAVDPSERPSAREVEARLDAVGKSIRSNSPRAGGPYSEVRDHLRASDDASGETMQMQTPPLVASAEIYKPRTLGRYRILEVLGEGGQGVVYRAEDPIDGSVVAIKMLRADRSKRPETLRRFRKEARLMAEVNNPFVVNLLEFNEESDRPYLVLEFVEGPSLLDLLASRRKLDERTAISIMVDVARGLMEPHGRGIIHRDIKPANILFVGSNPVADDEDGYILGKDPAEVAPAGDETVDLSPRQANIATRSLSSAQPLHAAVKISDFGLARHVIDSQSLEVTEAGSLMGTPQYMAPEQCNAQPVDSRTDVYAMGATLFHMLAGRPPFEATELDRLLAMHRHEPPPALDRLNPTLSDAACRIVAKSLAKSPDDRYHDAEAMHRDLERLLRGEPTEMTIHPIIPPCGADEIISLEFRWDLKASPRELWPYVSNTERVNRALGLTAPNFTTRFDPARGIERFASFRKYINFTWREHPFEWMEGRRFGVLREFSEGLFHWFHSLVELEPAPGGGTRLTHRIRVRPKGRLGRAMAHFELGRKGGRNLDRVYRRIDAAITGQLGTQSWLDPFEPGHELNVSQRRRMDAILDRMVERGVDLFLAERFGEFVSRAPAQEVARIRPLALAKRFDLDPEPVVAACLLGAAEGLLTLHWDLLCPVCQVSSEVKDTLKAIRDHGHCEACNIDYEIDFAGSVEMIFRVHPNIREAETGIFCIGGPAHSPHVTAQVRVAAGERIELNLALSEGSYRLRGPQLPWSVDFRVQPSASCRRWDFELSRGPADTLPRSLKPGDQVFAIKNDLDLEIVVRVERQVAREDALTAAQASTIATFRELFPGETLSPGQLVSVANLCLLAFAIEAEAVDELHRRFGDARAFAILQEHARTIEEVIRHGGGTVVRPIEDGILAAFNDSCSATRVALELVRIVINPGPDVLLEQATAMKASVHRGPVLAATTLDRLDYFGATVRWATRVLLPRARGGEVILGRAVSSDSEVASFLARQGISGRVLTIDDRGPNSLAMIIRA